MRRRAELEVDEDSREVRVDGSVVDLTRTEFDLLAALASRPGRVLQRETLLREVWQTDWEGSVRLVEAHMSNLRRKLQAAGLSNPEIKTVRGVGYRLVAEGRGSVGAARGLGRREGQGHPGGEALERVPGRGRQRHGVDQVVRATGSQAVGRGKRSGADHPPRVQGPLRLIAGVRRVVGRAAHGPAPGALLQRSAAARWSGRLPGRWTSWPWWPAEPRRAAPRRRCRG